ncbi:MAG: site-specific integrase [Paludibacter sp.]|nr:site-specific integrase [Paludibacter sp.]
MGKQVLITELVNKTYEQLKVVYTSEKTQQMYWYCGFVPICKYFSEQNHQWYSDAVINNCIEIFRQKYERGEIHAVKFRYVRKCALLMKEYLLLGKLEWKVLPHWNTKPLEEPFCSYMKQYESEMLTRGKSVTTIRGAKPIIKHFLLYIESSGHKDMVDVRSQEILDYLPVIAQDYVRVGDCLSILRGFGAFLLERGATSQDLTAILQLKIPTRKKYYFGFTHDEANRLISAIDRGTSIGKRDYAILILATHTGLRAIDVLNLRFQNIDWEKHEINLIQHKTKRALALPINHLVCNAIADYILNARPKSTLPEIFLRARSPYIPLKSWSAYSIVKRSGKKAGIKWTKEEHKGFHSFRRSMGSWMLEAEISLDTIKEVLGHEHRDSSKPYISTNRSGLTDCALGLDGIETMREELL